MTTERTTALALLSKESFLELVTENYGDNATPQFQQIKFPTSGSKSFVVSGLSGDETVEHLEGVVIFHHAARAYWHTAFSGGNLPDCSSRDGVVGIGDPGGACARCPYNQWGSRANGPGKACKDMRRLVILRSGEMMPIILTLPPTSLRPFNDYAGNLLRVKVSIRGVLTRIGLIITKNAGGIAYSQATFRSVGKLGEDDLVAIRALAEVMTPMVRRTAVDASEYNDGSPAPEDPNAGQEPRGG